MTMKFYKSVIILMMTCLILLSSCYKQERFTFKAGKYEYIGEQINFYNEMKINYISLTFEKVDFEESKENILINRKNKDIYHIDFYLENENKEGVLCKFKSLEKRGDQVDRYYIDVDISDYINIENSIIEVLLEINNSDYFYKDVKSNYTEANQIYMDVKSFKINDVYISSLEYSFPLRLLLKNI